MHIKFLLTKTTKTDGGIVHNDINVCMFDHLPNQPFTGMTEVGHGWFDDKHLKVIPIFIVQNANHYKEAITKTGYDN